jgi:hypothetical protein
MAWLLALTVLGFSFLGLCLVLRGYHRAQVDDLVAVIRAQRRRLDQLEAHLVDPGRKGRSPSEPSPN